MGCAYSCVDTGSVHVIERCGKFNRFAFPGFNLVHFYMGEEVKGALSTRIQQLDVSVESKTKDNVFVTIIVSVQYQVSQPEVSENVNIRWQQDECEQRRALLAANDDQEEAGTSLGHMYRALDSNNPPQMHQSLFRAFYTLTSVDDQIRAYIYDSVRSTIPKMGVDEVFSSKDDVARGVTEELGPAMKAFGFTIIRTLITDVIPAHRVKEAMNEINKAVRLRQAAAERAEAEKVAIVKKAEAEAEAKYLEGQGIARERQAIMGGLRESVEGFSSSVADIDSREVMSMVLMTTYFDALRDIGAHCRSSTVFVPCQPGALGDVSAQVREDVLRSQGP